MNEERQLLTNYILSDRFLFTPKDLERDDFYVLEKLELVNIEVKPSSLYINADEMSRIKSGKPQTSEKEKELSDIYKNERINDKMQETKPTLSKQFKITTSSLSALQV